MLLAAVQQCSAARGAPHLGSSLKCMGTVEEPLQDGVGLRSCLASADKSKYLSPSGPGLQASHYLPASHPPESSVRPCYNDQLPLRAEDTDSETLGNELLVTLSCWRYQPLNPEQSHFALAGLALVLDI